jgi:UDP-N-acetylmuramoyl-L-alanyl-D-glutamate--2,6-diaminopimelate ligase
MLESRGILFPASFCCNYCTRNSGKEANRAVFAATQPPGVSLRELFPRARFIGAADIRATACSADSRQCRAGDVFVALVGSGHDGHDYAARAIGAGARALLVERPLPGISVMQCVVPDTRVALGRLCQALAGNPSQRLRVVGVTGTNGKTTTSSLLASVLAAAGCRVGTLGTLGYFDSIESTPPGLTTPAAPELASWLARIEAAGCSHAVMEVSSHALAQSRVAGVEFDVACVTNVRRDHLDFHGTLENYRHAKQKFFDHLAPEGLVVLNVDDPVTAGFAADLHGPVLTVGIEQPAEFTATVVERFAAEQSFLLTAAAHTVPVRTRMIGDHHISNCLLAAAVGAAYGIDLPTIVRGLEAVSSVSGRLERIECGQPFGVFVDYAHTPDALATVLAALRQVVDGRLICVFGAGGNRDRQKRPLMGRAVARQADLAILTTDNPRDEDPGAIAGEVLAGLRNGADSQCRAEVVVELDREAAICRALALAEAGDCVLIAGKGHECQQIVGRTALPLDDREVARRWLYNIEPARAAAWDASLRMALANF